VTPRRKQDLDAVLRHSRPGDSATQIARKLRAAGVAPSRGGSWYAVRVFRVIDAMRRLMGGVPRKCRAGDVAKVYERQCGDWDGEGDHPNPHQAARRRGARVILT
jgi:hypothetical protein